jgi:SAP domain.
LFQDSNSSLGIFKNIHNRTQNTCRQENYEKMTVVQLKELLRKNGLTVSGKKSELIQRLEFYGDKKAREVVTASARKRERPTPLPEASQPDTASKKFRSLSPTPLSKKLVDAPVDISLSTRGKSSSVMTSSTKASDLRRRTPTEQETTQLITKRTNKKSPSAGTRLSTKTRKGSTIGKSSSSSSSRVLSRTTRTKPASSARVTELGNTTDAPSKLKSSSSRIRTSTESHSSISSSEKKTSTEKPVPLTKVHVDDKYNKGHQAGTKSTSPLGRRKIRTGGALTNVTNSAKKRKTARRQHMAKSVTAALAKLEKLQDVL